MAVYPGGTILDPGRAGYSLSRNFLSDLGMTVTHGGHQNSIGAVLFAASFGLVSLALVGCALRFLRLHASMPEARWFARAGTITGSVVVVCLLGTAVTPADLSAPLHMLFARTATAIAPLVVLLFAVAAHRDHRVSRGVVVAWSVLAVTMVVWFAMRWGPSVQTPAGLAVQALTQKAVAVVVVAVLTYQTTRLNQTAGLP
jgi:hypothetical protein